MNKFLLLILIAISILFVSKSFSQTGWRKIDSTTDKLLRHVFFVDSTTGWCAGRDGIIIHTSDGGNTWIEQNSNVQTFIVSLFFLDKNLGWALTIRDTLPFGTTVLETTNGGEEWIPTDYPEDNIFMNTIFYFDSLNGWIGFIDLAGVIWRTTDFGLNWSSMGVSPDQVFDMFVFDSLNAITLSGDPEGFFGIGNIKTTDAGENWSFEELPIFGLSFAIDFRIPTEGWSASGFKFLFTSDRGDTWIEKPTPDSAVIFDLTFADSSTGYAVGENGAILKYRNEIEIPTDSIPSDYILYQNYPNPFNSLTRINYSIKENGIVSLKVYDVLGSEVALLVNEEKPAGNNEVDFNGKGLASGVYFYRLSADGFVQTKKMVLLR